MKKLFQLIIPCIIAVCQASAQDCHVNILVAYSQDAADSLGSDSKITGAIVDAVNSMNTIYVYSNVQQQSVLVRTVLLPEDETYCFANDLNAFQSSSYIDSLRERYHADVAVIVLANDEFCGLPYLDNTLATSETAYCAVNFYCMLNNFAFSHQVAHLYGCAHAYNSRAGNSGSVYSYGHGFDWVFNECAFFSTILGVDDDDFCRGDTDGPEDSLPDPCNIIPYFSSPDLTYYGVALGLPGVNDNVRVLNQNAALIGSFQSVPENQFQLRDTVDRSNIALATAEKTLSTGNTYVITDSANVLFQCADKITLNPGFKASEGVRFETVLQAPAKSCGQ